MRSIKITLRLSEEARQGWDRAALASGVTLTALVEAMGRILRENHDFPSQEVIDRARQIDLERRSRR